MKKVLSLIVCLILFLCACSNGEQVQTDTIDIPFQKVAACNNRTKLLEKYNYITERTASRESENDNFGYWTMYFEKDQDNTNAILDYSVDYKCYYYNNEIFTEYGDGEIRTVIPYRENYEKIMATLLARSDTLSYVFIIDSSAGEDPDEEGYVAEYEFIVNNDILTELEGLGLEVGDRVQVEYDLDKDFIIKRCRYKRLDGKKEVEVARVDVTYGVKKSFPPAITERLGQDIDYVSVNIIEHFGTGAQYNQMFKVKKDTYISENDVLMRYYLFKDPTYSTLFDTMTEIISKDTDLFIVDSEHAGILQLQNMKKEQKQQENQTEE